MGFLKGIFALLGRACLSVIFIFSGGCKIFYWSETALKMEAAEMEMVHIFLALAILFEIVGGLSLLLGFKTRFGVLMLVAFLIPTTLIFHNFWDLEDPLQQQQQAIMFMKNLSVLGGLFYVWAYGPGKLSLDQPDT